MWLSGRHVCQGGSLSSGHDQETASDGRLPVRARGRGLVPPLPRLRPLCPPNHHLRGCEGTVQGTVAECIESFHNNRTPFFDLRALSCHHSPCISVNVADVA